ncbi:hypothetical protein JZ751_013190 [Albula glossodonta]|uniref:Uncharacterized protein n=1 Tax=Albula glossodonta TaxID=121402 RepID=A0A8T2NUB3_9TELE|nr:hypothetical protein JZ751_013190 [Albula glossodonta]
MDTEDMPFLKSCHDGYCGLRERSSTQPTPSPQPPTTKQEEQEAFGPRSAKHDPPMVYLNPQP